MISHRPAALAGPSWDKPETNRRTGSRPGEPQLTRTQSTGIIIPVSQVRAPKNLGLSSFSLIFSILWIFWFKFPKPESRFRVQPAPGPKQP